jgi:MOSC domain-containing protein YiiM
VLIGHRLNLREWQAHDSALTTSMSPDAPDVARGAVVSVNVGRARPIDRNGQPTATAIWKTPVSGRVAARGVNLAGDEQADRAVHGGYDKAVYAYALEDTEWWEAELGRALGPGAFGENLTTVGIDVNAAVLGEKWRIGSVLLQVCEVRIPCSVFKSWLGVSGFDDRGWAKRFTEYARPGPYLRVLEEGELQAGDAIAVEDRPAHGVTVTDMFRAFTTDPSLLPRLLDVDCVPAAAHAAATEYLHRTGTVAEPAV